MARRTRRSGILTLLSGRRWGGRLPLGIVVKELPLEGLLYTGAPFVGPPFVGLAFIRAGLGTAWLTGDTMAVSVIATCGADIVMEDGTLCLKLGRFDI